MKLQAILPKDQKQYSQLLYSQLLLLRDLSSVFKAPTFLECLVAAVSIMLRYIGLPKKNSGFV